MGTSEEQKPNLSAEKGAFQKFLDHYRLDSEQQFAQFDDLSIEIDSFSGEIRSIQEHPAESPKSEIKPVLETMASEEQGLNSIDRMKEPDPSGQVLQRRGRSHEDIPDVASWVVPHSVGPDRKSTRLNSSHRCTSRMPSSA